MFGYCMERELLQGLGPHADCDETCGIDSFRDKTNRKVVPEVR